MSWEETPWMTGNEVFAARKAYFDRKMTIMDAQSAMMDAEAQGRTHQALAGRRGFDVSFCLCICFWRAGLREDHLRNSEAESKQH